MSEPFGKTEEFSGHGWKLPGGKTICVGRLPERKQVALYFSYGAECWPVAYFRNDADAREVLDALDKLATGYVYPGPLPDAAPAKCQL